MQGKFTDFKVGDKTVRISVAVWRNEARLDIREMWQPEGAAELAPTKKGVQIPLERAEEFTSAIAGLLELDADEA